MVPPDLHGFHRWVFDSLDILNDFTGQVVVNRELGGAGERDPWATSFGQLACCELERRLGAYPVDGPALCTLPDY